MFPTIKPREIHEVTQENGALRQVATISAEQVYIWGELTF